MNVRIAATVLAAVGLLTACSGTRGRAVHVERTAQRPPATTEATTGPDPAEQSAAADESRRPAELGKDPDPAGEADQPGICEHDGRCCFLAWCAGEPWRPMDEFRELERERGVSAYAYRGPSAALLGHEVSDFRATVAGGRVLGLTIELRGDDRCAAIRSGLEEQWGEADLQISAEWWEWEPLSTIDADFRIFRGARASHDPRDPGVVRIGPRCVLQLFDVRYDDEQMTWTDSSKRTE